VKLNLGVDIGGTKIHFATVHFTEKPEVVSEFRIATPKSPSYSDFVNILVDNLKELIAKSKGEVSSVGIGIPGIVVVHNNPAIVSISRLDYLVGQDIERDLSSKLNLPVYIENDTRLFTLAEATYGAGKGIQSVFGVILGTGIGGGLTYSQDLISSQNGAFLEWGHLEAEPGGEQCHCGSRGCYKTVISGPALENYYFEKTGQVLPLVEISKLAENNKDPNASETMSRFITFLVGGLKSAITIIDPDIVVIGGGLSNIEVIYTQAIPALRKSLPLSKSSIVISRSTLGDSAGAIGAALLAKRKF